MKEDFKVKILQKKVIKKGVNGKDDYLELKTQCLSENFKEISVRMKELIIKVNYDRTRISKEEVYTIKNDILTMKNNIKTSSKGFVLEMSKKEVFYKNEGVESVALKNFLKKNVKGIGEVKAKDIISIHGDNLINFVYENYDDIDILKENLPKMNKTQIKDLIDAIFNFDVFNQISVILASKAIITNYQNDIYMEFGDDSIKILTTSPFRLKSIMDVDDFKKFLSNTTIPKTQLVYSLIESILEDDLQTGNTIMLKNNVEKRAKSIKYNLNLNIDDFNYTLKSEMKKFPEIKKEYIQLPKVNFQERFIAKTLIEIRDFSGPKSNKAVELAEYLNEEQKDAIRNVLKNNLSIITGGAGTGKTTVLKEIIKNMLNNEDYDVISLLAPTGKAAQRITESINDEDFVAETIHKRIEMFKRGLIGNGINVKIDEETGEEIQKYRFFIIDETSMANTETIYNFLLSLTKMDKVLFVGDVQQLESIGYGAVFKDMINSNQFNVNFLITKVRQGDCETNLTKLIDDIEQKKFNLFSYNLPDDSFKFININSIDNKTVIKSLFNNLKNKGYEADGSTNQCLAPMNIGLLGNDDINESITEIVESKSNIMRSLIINHNTFREHMPVIITANNKELEVLNGMTGMITEINDDSHKKSNHFISVRIDAGEGLDNPTVTFKGEMMELLKPAYSISIHKSQGSEYSSAYIVLPKESEHMLNFNLIYTAITRAKSKVVIIGDERMVKKALIKENKRNTGLLELLITKK